MSLKYYNKANDFSGAGPWLFIVHEMFVLAILEGILDMSNVIQKRFTDLYN